MIQISSFWFSNTYNLFIPYKNITSLPVHVIYIASPQALSAVISDIKTQTTENTIELSFKSSRMNRELIIYRSNEPIDKYTDLLKASLITIIPSSDKVTLFNRFIFSCCHLERLSGRRDLLLDFSSQSSSK